MIFISTEVSKDAAAMILTDDNFATIIKAVANGRNVYTPLQRRLEMNKSNSRSDQNLLGAQPDVVRQTVDDSLLGRPHVAEKAFSTEATKVMPKGEKTPDERFADLQDMTRGYLTDEEEAKLEKAFRFAASAHEGACRKSGEPFIAHPVEVAIILADLRMDVETCDSGSRRSRRSARSS